VRYSVTLTIEYNKKPTSQKTKHPKKPNIPKNQTSQKTKHPKKPNIIYFAFFLPIKTHQPAILRCSFLNPSFVNKLKDL